MARHTEGINFGAPLNIAKGIYTEKIGGDSQNDFDQVVCFNVVLEGSSNPPTSGVVAGRLIYNTASQRFGWYDGTTWKYAQAGQPISVSSTTSIILNLDGNNVLSATLVVKSDGAIEITSNGADLKTIVTPSTNPLITYDKYGRITSSSKLDLSSNYVEINNDINFNSKKITNLADPANDMDAVNYRTLLNASMGFKFKEPVDLCATSNITLSGVGQSLDGVSITSGMRILVTGQTSASANGIYEAKSGTWTRTDDFNFNTEIPGAFIIVKRGTTWADTIWLCTNDTVNINVDPITIVNIPFVNQINARYGLVKTGNILDVDLASVSGLEFDGSEKLKVKIEANKGLSISANGLKAEVESTFINVGVAGISARNRYKQVYFTVVGDSNNLVNETIDLVSLGQTHLSSACNKDNVAVLEFNIYNINDTRMPAGEEIIPYKKYIKNSTDYRLQFKFNAQVNKEYQVNLTIGTYI